MNIAIHAAIEENYDIEIVSCVTGERGAIAETFVINGTYFCKVIRKPMVMACLQGSLPLAATLTDAGVMRINRLIKPRNGLSVHADGAIIVLTEYLRGMTQSRDYDMKSFGTLLAQVHAVETDIQSPREDFSTVFSDIFEVIQSSPAADAVGEDLKKTLLKYGDTLHIQLEVFRRKAEACKKETPRFCVTHGDIGGNVMTREKNDLFIIDWDEAIIAPPERDTWLFATTPGFMAGYKTPIHPLMQDFYTYKSHFINAVFRIEDILDMSIPEDKRRESLKKLDWRISPEGWMQPMLSAITS